MHVAHYAYIISLLQLIHCLTSLLTVFSKEAFGRKRWPKD